MPEPNPARLLIVDDETELMNTLCEMLESRDYEVAGFTSGNKALEALREESFDILLTDLMMPEADGVSLLKAALGIDPHIIGIIMTGHGTVQTAVEAMKTGAFDYVMKPFKLNALMPILARAMQVRQLRLENMQLREALAIYELSQAIAFTLDASTILRETTEAARHLCHADEVSVILPTEDGGELYEAIIQGQGRKHLPGERLPIDRGVVGWVINNHKSCITNGPVGEPSFVTITRRDSVRATISMPMITGSKVVGVLNVNATGPRRSFTPGQAKALSILAGIAASGLENASLHERVLKAEREYRSIFENAIEGIFVTSPEGRILTANPALARLLGYDSPEEMMAGVTDTKTQLYADTERHKEFLQVLDDNGTAQGFEAQLYCKDRSKVWASLSARAIRTSNGDLAFYEGSVEDITERKRLEEQFLQSQKMEAIGMLAGGVAHDFNNSLTVIIGYTQLALNQLRPGDPINLEINEINRAAQRATMLTNQLLAFSRKQVIQPKVLDLNKVVAETEKMLKRLIGEDVILFTDLHPAIGRVKADHCQLEQIVVNLAVNARDAMPQGGRLNIETANIFLDEAYAKHHVEVQPGQYVMFVVSDTGCGMDEETRSHIFEPFFTTKERGKGTGLGLSTVYGIVKQSGGHIQVYSEQGHGTSFRIYLPSIEEIPKRLESREPTVEVVRGSETILLVEDEELVRNLVHRILESSGYTILEASNPNEALEECRQHSGLIHMMITDLVMPQMNGRELARQVSDLRPATKILYMSGYANDSIAQNGMLSADIAFLQKPFTLDALTRKVREVMVGPGR